MNRSGSFLGEEAQRGSLVGSAFFQKKKLTLDIVGFKIKEVSQYKKQPVCQVCFKSFTGTNRQHHCRACANAVCNDCSRSEINKER
jgi:superfamily II helicase